MNLTKTAILAVLAAASAHVAFSTPTQSASNEYTEASGSVSIDDIGDAVVMPAPIGCPSSTPYGGGRVAQGVGPYANEAAARAAVAAGTAKDQVVADAERRANALCPKKCDAPNQNQECMGDTDLSGAPTGNGRVFNLAGTGWVVYVTLDYTGQTVECKCDV